MNNPIAILGPMLLLLMACSEPPRSEIANCILRADGNIYDLRDVGGFDWSDAGDGGTEIFIVGTYDHVRIDPRDYEMIERAWAACRATSPR